MLMLSKHLVPIEQKISFMSQPFYIVFTENKNNIGKDRIYVKHFGLEKFPTILDDTIIEQTENIWDALKFLKKEDAIKVAGLCTFRCNCGCVDKVGKLIRMSYSGRMEDGVTYGEIKLDTEEQKKRHFEVFYDCVEEEKEYPQDYTNHFDY